VRTEPENEAEVRAAFNEAIVESGSATWVAERLGVSNAYVSLVRSGKKPVPPKIAAFLGFRRVVKWEEIGERELARGSTDALGGEG
jgi:hypothetical protein